MIQQRTPWTVKGAQALTYSICSLEPKLQPAHGIFHSTIHGVNLPERLPLPVRVTCVTQQTVIHIGPLGYPSRYHAIAVLYNPKLNCTSGRLDS
jgi:hypothetical protein